MKYSQARDLTGNAKAAKALVKGEKPEVRQIKKTAFGTIKRGLFLGGECIATYWNDEPVSHRSFMAYAMKLGYAP